MAATNESIVEGNLSRKCHNRPAAKEVTSQVRLEHSLVVRFLQ